MLGDLFWNDLDVEMLGQHRKQQIMAVPGISAKCLTRKLVEHAVAWHLMGEVAPVQPHRNN